MYKTEKVEIETKRQLQKGVYVRSGRCGCLYSDNWAKAMGLECALDGGLGGRFGEQEGALENRANQRRTKSPGLPRGRMRNAEPHDCEKMGV